MGRKGRAQALPFSILIPWNLQNRPVSALAAAIGQVEESIHQGRQEQGNLGNKNKNQSRYHLSYEHP